MFNKIYRQRRERGFSLLELMIAMFILIILISVAIPTYQRSVQHAKETVLHENLWQMRRAIDQFYADKGHLPKSIDDLVTEKYLRERPIDPVTESTEWTEVQGDDPAAKEGETGLKDVKSTADGLDSNGQEYSKY
ncbi:MAG: type II secretion system protein [Acidobacteria bacterium]|nr:type II secretion system protein [Acidobacteriota bacterium]